MSHSHINFNTAERLLIYPARPPLSASATAPILTSFQAKKRHLIDKRLQDRLRKETDSVRRAEEAKKDKHTANRKEEEIQLKNTIVSLFCLSLDVGS
jgi:aminopeptidase C